MNWTPQQEKAITLRNKNILVAAAAGSGKTAVLVERIKRIVLEESCSVSNMLIVTFTNAAAAEMREKIEKALRSEIAQTKDAEKIRFLKGQLDELPLANISTFHAFALEVIHRYFFLIDVAPNFKICDNIQQELLKAQAMDELLEELFDENRTEFNEFLNAYSGDRNENKIREIIGKTFAIMESLPNPQSWMDEKIQQLDENIEEFSRGPIIEAIWEDAEMYLLFAEMKLKETLVEAEKLGMDALVSLTNSDLWELQELRACILERDFNEMARKIENFSIPALIKKYFKTEAEDVDEFMIEAVKRMAKMNRGVLKQVVSELKESYFYQSLQMSHEEIRGTYESGKFLGELLSRYRQKYQEKKTEKGLVDFSDIEHFAYKILENAEAAQFYRNKFQHIFIDEYQDSNILQEALIGLIKSENNLFMVGDVKQSIYKFRLAEPEIFQEKYKKFQIEMEEKGTESRSEKIDLNQNFRSKESVIDFINKVFEDTMGGYDKEARLYLGDPHGRKCNYQPQLCIAQTPWGEEDDLDDDLKMLIKAEKEALAAVKLIKEYLGKPIFDSKQGIERPLQKGDIVILLRGLKNYSGLFYKVLVDNQLPAFVDDNEGYFDTIEIQTFLSLLQVIDNEKQDIPLLSVLRSEIFGFSTEELVEIRIRHKEGSYYEAFRYCGEQTRDALNVKCASAMKRLREWQSLSRILPLGDLVWQLLLSSGFYVSMGAMPAGSHRQANLRALVDKAQFYSASQMGSLYGFISYIDAVKQRKVSMGQVKLVGEDEDVIRIMTIHKSKGLEYPMVLLAGYCRKLNYTRLGNTVMIHKDLGIAFPVVNYNENWFKTSLLQNIMKLRVHQAEEEEEKRILYVAMTRAKDILCLLGIGDDVQEMFEKVEEELPQDTSYFTMTGKTIVSSAYNRRMLKNEELTTMTKGRKRSVKNILEQLDKSREYEQMNPKIQSKMEYSYAFQKDLEIKSKYSVSELNQPKIQNDSLAQPKTLQIVKKLSAAQIGVIIHKVLEYMDFALAQKEGKSYIDQLIEKMIAMESLTKEEAMVVDAQRLLELANSPIGKRLVESGNVYRERPFNLLREVNGGQTIVQGMIDCYFEEGGELVLIDYKTTNIAGEDEFQEKKEEIRNNYQKQIDIYCQALEEATGKRVKEAILYLTNIGQMIEM